MIFTARLRHVLLTAVALAPSAALAEQDAGHSVSADEVAAGHVLDNRGGVRDAINDAGIDLSITYKGEAATNVSGAEDQRVTQLGQLAFSAGVDMGKIAGIDGGKVTATVSYRHGKNLNTVAGIDTLQQIEEVYGRGQTWRLSELSYEQVIAGGSLVLKGGRISAGDFNSFDCEFMSVSWCGAPAGNITSYWYNFPIAQWGAWAKLRSHTGFVRLGLQEDNRNNLDNAFFVSRSGAKGVILHAEAGWTPGSRGALPGRYVLGYWQTSADDPDVLSDAAGTPFPLSGATPRRSDGRHGVYAQMQQQLTGTASIDPVSSAISRARGLSIFANAIRADRATATILDQETAGLYLDQPFAARPQDHAGVALARTHYNPRAALAQVLLGADSERRKSEYVGEIYYAVGLSPGISFRPSLQYIANPGGFQSAQGTFVIGTRLDLDL